MSNTNSPHDDVIVNEEEEEEEEEEEMDECHDQLTIDEIKLSKKVLEFIDDLPVDDGRKETVKEISLQLMIDFTYRLPFMFQIYLTEAVEEFSKQVSEDIDIFRPIADQITFETLHKHLD